MEILEKIQKEILTHLKDLPDVEAFYLTGGTALAAFYLGHRKSNDLDFFTTTEELILPFSRKIATIYPKNMADFASVNEVYGGYFPSDPPARATGEVSRLPKDVAVEMDFVAWKG